MNKLLIVANWKANAVDAKQWLQQLISGSEKNRQKDRVEIAVAPPFSLLSLVSAQLAANPLPLPVSLASQDISMFPAGQYTGEVPCPLLVSQGVKYCLIGHSERRKYLKETNEQVEAKLQQAFGGNIVPIICAQNLDEIPNNIRNYSPEKYYIMYEPSRAISTGGEYHPESPDDIKSVLTDWQSKLPSNTRFLYGGSVNPENVMPITNTLSTHFSLAFSGFVVGHASLDPASFFAIISALCA